jgi:hypothetical protein
VSGPGLLAAATSRRFRLRLLPRVIQRILGCQNDGWLAGMTGDRRPSRITGRRSMANENENRELTAEELESVSAGTNGITRLVAVSTLKANNANDDAMAGALAGALAGVLTKGPHKIG